MYFRDKYDFLSNMYTCEIEYNGYTYFSVESAFQAQKDPSQSERFINLTSKLAKKEGRKVKLRNDWEDVKVIIMKDLLKIKFSNPNLKQKLLEVTEPIIEENTWNDTYWGVCKGFGENMLGKLLTEVRDEILKEVKE